MHTLDAPPDKRPTDERPTDERPTDERPTDERPTDERPTGIAGAPIGPTVCWPGLIGRTAMLIGGAATIGALVAVIVWNDLGPGPIDSFVVGLHQAGDLPLSVTFWGFLGLVGIVAWMLGRPPGIGTVIAPFVAGYVIEVVLSALASHEPPDATVARLVIQVAAVGAAGVGVAVMVLSRLGAGPPELLSEALSCRTRWSRSRIRTGFELCCLAGGLSLGGPAGLGTLVVAALIGPSIALGLRLVGAVLAAGPRAGHTLSA